jgi:hypothetical protein
MTLVDTSVRANQFRKRQPGAKLRAQALGLTSLGSPSVMIARWATDWGGE